LGSIAVYDGLSFERPRAHAGDSGSSPERIRKRLTAHHLNLARMPMIAAVWLRLKLGRFGE
jgi:hypothetical protein